MSSSPAMTPSEPEIAPPGDERGHASTGVRSGRVAGAGGHRREDEERAEEREHEQGRGPEQDEADGDHGEARTLVPMTAHSRRRSRSPSTAVTAPTRER